MFNTLTKRFFSNTHKERLLHWRQSLLNRTANRTTSQLQSLLYKFSKDNVPFLTEDELSELDNILRLDDTQINDLIERPGSPAERHPMLKNNFTLDRFLNFARFKSGNSGEYR